MTSVRADTPFPTPDGWAVAGELHPGDHVFSASGKPIQVVVVNQERPKAALSVKMVMDPITVSADHDVILGLPWYGKWKGPEELLAERERRLIQPLSPVRRVVLELPHLDLPLDPWVYGYWRVLHLPDGVIGVPSRLATKARAHLEAVNLPVTKTFTDRDMTYLTSADLAMTLEKIGEWPSFHPDYLRAGIKQRRDLLTGITDARGRFMNGVTIEATQPVADAVADLAMGLGLRASTPAQGHPRVRMSPHDAVMMLRSEELHEHLHGPDRPGYRTEVPYMIRKAEPAEVGDFVNIKTVDGTYLVSQAMLPARDH